MPSFRARRVLGVVALLQLLHVASLAPPPGSLSTMKATTMGSRRDFLGAVAVVTMAPKAALAKKDCMEDCVQNCKRVAPGSKGYCESTCSDYCDQPDREDGLSGSIGDGRLIPLLF